MPIEKDGYLSIQEGKNTFTQKVWIVGGVFSLIVIIILLLEATFNVLLLVLAGSLIAIFFRGLSGWIQGKTKWKPGICLAIATIGCAILVTLLFWAIGAKIQSQTAQLSETMPVTVENAKNQLNRSALGQKIVEKISSPQTLKKVQSMAQTFFKSTFGVLGDIYVVLFIGVFFTVSPKTYKNGLIQLIPAKRRSKADDIVSKIGNNLEKWLKGKIFAMFVVFILTAVGLLILGVPMWLTLAVIAGILNFIPNFGPLMAMVPAVLVGLGQGPEMAAWITALYILIQVVESNFITPLVQQKLISIPPAIIIIAQLLIAPLTGGWGLVLATPLMVILIVLVKELYVKHQDTIGDI